MRDGFGLRRLAHPNPDEMIALDHRVGRHERAGGNLVLAGDVDAFAGAVEHHAVIAALQPPVGDFA